MYLQKNIKQTNKQTNFLDWVAVHDFGTVYTRPDVNDQLDAFLGALMGKMDEYFTMKTTTRVP